MAVLPKASFAVTVTLAVVPAVTEAGVAVTAERRGAAGLTVMPRWCP